MEKQVDNLHPVYAKNQPKRDLFSAISSTYAMREGGVKYLPKYPAEGDVHYAARLGQATIDGIVANGVTGLCGKVFHEPPNIDAVNPEIQPLLENFDNEGNHFSVFAQKAFEAAFDGFSVIIIDTPKAESELRSLGDEKRQGIRPYGRIYKAKDVTNWRWTVDPVTKKTRLALLVLKEVSSEPDGPFAEKSVVRYRVYRHEQQVTQEVWRKKEQNDENRFDGQDFLLEQRILMPTVTAIPASIIGDLCAEPWLMIEVELEKKAYQKESSFDAIEYLSIPILVIEGRQGEAVGTPIPYGPSTFLDVPEKCGASYAQIDSAGHGSLKQTIEGIKSEISGKLDAVSTEVMPSNDMTATQVISDDSKSKARLVVWSGQCQDALNRSLQFMGQLMALGEDNGGTVELRTAWEVAQEQMNANAEAVNNA